MHAVLQELGTYCGYSTVLLSNELKAPGSKVYTVDVVEANVAVARKVIAHAGLTSKVEHVMGPLQENLQVSSCCS